MEVTREEMLELARRETYHLDDRLVPFSRETLRAEAWLLGYEFAKDHGKEEKEEKPEEASLPFYPVRAGDVFYCTNDCCLYGDDGREVYIAYTAGNTYVSEIDGCITDDHGRKDHMWNPDGMGVLAANFLRKVRRAPQLITEGTWVVTGASAVGRVLHIESGMAVVEMLLEWGVTQYICSLDDLRKWTPEDAGEGDILTAEEEDGTDVIFITMGSGEGVGNAIAAYNVFHNRFWRDYPCRLASTDRLRPANQEERMILMSKIRVSGLLWDEDAHRLVETDGTSHGGDSAPQQDTNGFEERIRTIEERLSRLEADNVKPI